MELDDAITLLKSIGIRIVEINGEIFHDETPNENMPFYDHYGIICDNGEWYYVFSKVERVTIPEVEKIKKFDSKNDAVKFLFLKCLHKYLLQEKILPAINPTINMWNMDAVKEFLITNNIPDTYFSYNNSISKNSMHYYKKDLLYFEYIGKNGEPLARSLCGFDHYEESDVWRGSILYISLLYMLDIFEHDMNKKGFSYQFDDIDRVNFLGMTAL
jgi:hypothetical protein